MNPVKLTIIIIEGEYNMEHLDIPSLTYISEAEIWNLIKWHKRNLI